MTYQLIKISIVLVLIFLGGCASTGPTEVSQNEAVNEVEDVAQTAEVSEVDLTSEPTQVEETDPPAEPTQTNTVQPQETDEAVATQEPTEAAATEEPEPTEETAQADETAAADLAHVTAVSVSGNPGDYSFSVEVFSPDTGCQQYADWWEVLSEKGELIYRRVLLHSHVNEQPFIRSGGPVDIAADEVVWVRAHMNPGGYGGMAFTGSVESGFQEAELSPDFAAGAAELSPLPDGCAF